ncbi:MAG: hypothetical protein ACYC43_06800 [Burkholderiales bacterium]
MKNPYSSASLFLFLLASMLAIADNGSYSNPYGKDYGLAHTHGYLIQKRAASVPYTTGNKRPDNPDSVLPNNSRGTLAGDQEARLRALETNDRTSSADRGWIRQETNRVDRNRAANPNLIYGNTQHPTANTVRNPPGKNLVQNLGRYNSGSNSASRDNSLRNVSQYPYSR